MFHTCNLNKFLINWPECDFWRMIQNIKNTNNVAKASLCDIVCTVSKFIFLSFFLDSCFGRKFYFIIYP